MRIAPIVCVACLLTMSLTPAQAQDPGVWLSRSLNATTYTPGERLEITLSIESTLTLPPRGFAIEESIPEGWLYSGVIAGDQPSLEPFAGTTSLLEFVWFAVPEFPASFTYTIRVPEDVQGPQEISGVVIYRTDGPELRSPHSLHLAPGNRRRRRRRR